MTKDREVRLEVKDNALLVANGGRAFSRGGVISICASHLSDKRLSQSDDEVRDDFGGADEDLVRRIQARELETYRRDPNRITADYRGEDETSRDYGGRFLWELLQNAVDAMGDDRSSGEFIGSKGLGFKAVLELTETPEIYSGPFHFLFSASETQNLLKEQDLHDNPPPLTFRIPHTATPDEGVKDLLDAGYTTVIRLPLKDDAVKGTVVDQLQDLDPLFMLLVPQLSTLRVIGPNGETVHRTHSADPGLSDGVVRFTTECPAGPQSTCWRRWAWTHKQNGKRLTAAICLPLAEGDAGVPVADCRTNPLFVFFPTQHDTKMRAVVHVSFDLAHNREHTRPGDHDDQILEAFKGLLRRVIDECPVKTVLEAFGQTGLDDQAGNPSSAGRLPGDRLPPTAWRTVSEARFVPTVGGSRESPGEVRLWRHRLGFVLKEDIDAVRNARLLAPGLRSLWSPLCQFGAEELSTAAYVDLLRHCRNRSVSECVLSWMTLTRVLQYGYTGREDDQLEVPCWWTEQGVARPLAGGLPMLRPRVKNWPDWLEADVLHTDMWRAVTPKQRRPRWWSKYVLDAREKYCDQALYPHIATWTKNEWRASGWTVLDQFRQWYPGPKDVGPWVPDNGHTIDRRATAAKYLRVPTDKGWLPPTDCYAGHAWGGVKAFDRYFAAIRDRGLLLPLDQWPEQVRQETIEDDWKSLLRWLGVSWEPKVRAMELPPHETVLPELWSDYEKGIRPTYWIFNLFIEHFPQCLLKSNVDDEPKYTIVQSMSRLADVVKTRKASYFRFKPKECLSFAWCQLCKEEWLPCEHSLLHHEHRVAPANAFMPGKGFNGLLPEVSRGDDHEEWYGSVVGVLRQLGVRDALPDDPNKWHYWMRRLSDVGNRSVNPDSVRKAAEALYRGYLRLECDAPFPTDIRLPCLVADEGGPVLAFASASDVYYVDAPHLQEVRDEIIQKGYKLFILSLRAGKRAVSQLQISLLSSVLRAEVQSAREDARATWTVRRRYEQRRVGLTLAADLENELPSDLPISVVENLQVDLVDREKVASVDVLSWQAGEDQPLLLNQRNQWRAFGDGLARWVIRQESKAMLFEALLREDSRQEYEDRLLQSGVTRADVDDRAMADWPAGSDNSRGDSSEPRSGSRQGDSTTDESRPEDVSDRRGADSVNGGQSTVPERRRGLSGRGNGRGTGASRRRASRGDSRGRSSSPNLATGRAAEDWLGERLKRVFPGAVWRRVRDSQNRESDFIIDQGSMRYHIEVKHLANTEGKIYWSQGQCGKALDMRRESGEEYFMALLLSRTEGRYRIYWSWDPLSDLQAADRDVQWEGASDFEDMESDSWDVADQQPDNVPVKRHMFRIHVDQELVDDLDKDDESLQKLRERLQGK